jgi:hypothetical protein
MDDKIKKQLISILNHSLGANIIKDITHTETSKMNENNLNITCVMLNDKTKTCVVSKNLIKLFLKDLLIDFLNITEIVQ